MKRRKSCREMRAAAAVVKYSIAISLKSLMLILQILLSLQGMIETSSAPSKV